MSHSTVDPIRSRPFCAVSRPWLQPRYTIMTTIMTIVVIITYMLYVAPQRPDPISADPICPFPTSDEREDAGLVVLVGARRGDKRYLYYSYQ